MNRQTLIGLAAFSVLVFGFIAYTRMTVQAPPVELPQGITNHGGDEYGVAGFAVIDSVGLVQAPESMYYDLALPLDADVIAFIRSHHLYLATFKPAFETEWQDSLGRAPVIAGTWIYYRE